MGVETVDYSGYQPCWKRLGVIVRGVAFAFPLYGLARCLDEDPAWKSTGCRKPFIAPHIKYSAARAAAPA